MTLTDILVPTYLQMLRALSAWLYKAQAQGPEDKAEALLSTGRIADVCPLPAQIRFGCAQAQEAVFRLRGEAFGP